MYRFNSIVRAFASLGHDLGYRTAAHRARTTKLERVNDKKEYPGNKYTSSYALNQCADAWERRLQAVSSTVEAGVKSFLDEATGTSGGGGGIPTGETETGGGGGGRHNTQKTAAIIISGLAGLFLEIAFLLALKSAFKKKKEKHFYSESGEQHGEAGGDLFASAIHQSYLFLILAMSSDNAPSAVTYTSISSDSDGPSWGIPLMNANDLSKIDPYEEVAQQGQAPPLSSAYVPDPMELDEHVLVYVSEPEHPEHHVPSDDDMQVEDQPYVDDASLIAESPGHIADSESMEEDSIDYPDDPEDDDEDPEEDPEEDHTDYHADGGDGDDEPSDDDYDDDIDDEDEEPTEDEGGEEEEGKEDHLAPADPFAIPIVDLVPSAGITGAFETDESAPTPRSPQIRILFSQTHLRRAQKTVRLEPPMTAFMEDMPPQRRFVLTAPPHGGDVAESFAAAATRPPREDVGYVRALHESEDLYTQLHDTWTDRRDIRLKIDVVRGQRTAYETELQEVCQAYLSSEAQNRAILARLETLETHMSRMEWQRQSAEDLAVRQMMCIHALEARARIDTDDASQNSGGGPRRPVQPARVCSHTDFIKCQPLNFKGTEGDVGLSQWLEKMESIFHISGYAVDNQVKFANCTLLGATLAWWNGQVGTLGHDVAYAMTWGMLKKKLTDKYCPKGEIKKLEIKLWNPKVRGNDVAAYTQRFQELALMCTKFLADETEKVDKYISGLPDNIHRNVMSARPKTLDDAIELANDLMDQKLRTYAERHNDNKRKADDSSRNNQQQQPYNKPNVAKAYIADPSEKKAYTGNLPLCTKCNYTTLVNAHPSVKTARGACYECGNTWHIKRNCPKLKNHGNENRNGVAQGRGYALGGRDASPDSNVITGVNTIIRGYTLNFMNHPFNIDLMPVPLSSFDVIIGMDWLTKYHGVIICDEKIVRMGCLLAHITTKEAKEKSEEKRLEDVLIVRDFPEDLPGSIEGSSQMFSMPT
nr:hypothetical protein [Tanacetum cinerariifolium]